MEKPDLRIQDLDFSENELTEKERLVVITLLLRSNGPLSQDELQRQAIAVEELIVETKCAVNALRLVFKGLLDVLVTPEGEVSYRATEAGFKAAGRID
jgi:hypothetical protein